MHHLISSCKKSSEILRRRRKKNHREKTNMTVREEKGESHHHDHHQHEKPAPPPPQPPQYGTFQGVANHPPPSYGFPQPITPPGISGVPPPPEYYSRGYQAVPVYGFAEGRPVRQHRLACCGLGIGWFFFILGFFIAGIPWYVAALLLCCSRIDPREKPGYVASTIAAVLATIAVIFGLTRID